jgi:hypothetical protein
MTTVKKMKLNESENTDLKLIIEGNYKDWEDFYKNNKQTVYENIVDLFALISTDKKETGSLIIFYDIEKTTFNTVFHFGKSDKEMLKDVFIPYFSGIEEYETCSKVTSLYNTLSN